MTSNVNRIYATNTSGTQTTLNYGTAATNNYIVQRGTSGQVTVPSNPSATTDAASKNYVDNSTLAKYRHSIVMNCSNGNYGYVCFDIINNVSTAYTTFNQVAAYLYSRGQVVTVVSNPTASGVDPIVRMGGYSSNTMSIYNASAPNTSKQYVYTSFVVDNVSSL